MISTFRFLQDLTLSNRGAKQRYLRGSSDFTLNFLLFTLSFCIILLTDVGFLWLRDFRSWWFSSVDRRCWQWNFYFLLRNNHRRFLCSNLNVLICQFGISFYFLRNRRFRPLTPAASSQFIFDLQILLRLSLFYLLCFFFL